MKLALLIGVRDQNPEQPLEPGPSLAAIEGLLTELGGWTCVRVDGAASTRTGILDGLRRSERTIGPDDTFLFYFFGHGGVVEIEDLPPPLGRRPVFYVAAVHTDASSSFEAVLDVELSLALARIDAICGNVSVILDSCYSARLLRGPAWKLRSSPAWVRQVAEQTGDGEGLLAPESHPHIVRLAAASSLRWAYAEAVPGGRLGRLTRAFVEVVREAMPHVDRLTWDALAHRAREQVIWQLGCEDQWVTLAGPRDRLLFSRRAAAPARTVGFVPYESKPGGWIRAGALQNVQIDDEWGLAELTVDDRLRPRWRARMRVTNVELNRAMVEPLAPLEITPPPGTSAHLLAAHRRHAVITEGPVALRSAVDASSLLRAADEAESTWLARLSAEHDHLAVRPRSSGRAATSFSTSAPGIAAAIDLLEDWARAQLLLELLESHPAARSQTIRVSWNYAHSRRRLPLDDPQLRMHIGDRVHFQVSHVGGHGDWFVSAIELGVDGRPALINASEPEGHEIRPGDTIELGRRGAFRHDGFELTWPVGLAADRPRPVTILFLASPRPIELGHLAGSPRRDGLLPFVRAPRRARVRGRLAASRPRMGPEPIGAWAWQTIHYQLDPKPA